MMRRALRRVLFETRIGDLLLRSLERVTGLALVDVGEIEGDRYGATAAGIAASSRVVLSQRDPPRSMGKIGGRGRVKLQ